MSSRKGLTQKRPTNNMRRIARARAAVRGYAGEHHDLDANIVDILTDLRHLCDAKGIDFDKANRLAGQHYQAEGKPGKDALSVALSKGLEIHITPASGARPASYQGRFDEEWVTESHPTMGAVCREWCDYEGYEYEK